MTTYEMLMIFKNLLLVIIGIFIGVLSTLSRTRAVYTILILVCVVISLLLSANISLP